MHASSRGTPRERRPHVDELRELTEHLGVAFFMPAFNEEESLWIAVPRAVEYFTALGCPFTVIIVDDGSTDGTFEAAKNLARIYAENVRVVHYPENRGYGGALQTGIRAALNTEHGLIGFCDADVQFHIESFGTLLMALLHDEADLAVGYRIERADSLRRRLMGRAWHALSGIALGATTVRDVDCGFKLFTRGMLATVAPQLTGEFASTSPELLARAAHLDFTIVEAGLTHRPRVAGHNTGSDLGVVIRSLEHLYRLRLQLRKERRNASRRHTEPPGADE